MKTGKITRKFQLTLPKEFVEELGLQVGGAVLYELKGGKIIITPLVPFGETRDKKKRGGQGK